jgi:hypothetical protein
MASDTTRPASLGWLELSCLILVTTGAFGIMAIGTSSFYDRGASYVIGDLEGWGVVILVLGVVPLVAAASAATLHRDEIER